MFKSKPVLEYGIVTDIDHKPFTLAKSVIPDWYKDAPPWDPNVPRWEFPNTFKQCLPFWDAMSSGYMVTLPADIIVHNEGEEKFVNWNPQAYDNVIYRFNPSIEWIPAPPGFHKYGFAWKFPVALKVPDGYNFLITHPINRFDLPFFTMSGVIDGGYTLFPYANVSFWMRQDFEGIIPQGTPIGQIIPMKQESWSSKQNQSLLEEGEYNRRSSSAWNKGWYKKKIWKRKLYT